MTPVVTSALTGGDWGVVFAQYLLLSILSIGGAIGTAPEMHRFLVEQHHWMTNEQFSASVAIAQAAPGPNLLFVAVLGWVHGIGWIVMSLLCLAAVRRRVIPGWLGVMVAIVGGVGPFAGSAGFYYEERRLRHDSRGTRPAVEKVS